MSLASAFQDIVSAPRGSSRIIVAQMTPATHFAMLLVSPVGSLGSSSHKRFCFQHMSRACVTQQALAPNNNRPQLFAPHSCVAKYSAMHIGLLIFDHKPGFNPQSHLDATRGGTQAI